VRLAPFNLVTLITDPSLNSCQPAVGKDMCRRLIAGLLMLMLSATGAFAQRPPVPSPTTRMPSVHVHAPDAHPCCHSNATAQFETAMPLPPAGMPCGSEHTCCVSPGPTNFAEVPSTSGQPRPEACQSEALPGYSDNPDARPVVKVPCGDRLLSYGAFSTVLRI
jgi:hypothetical protein